MSNPTSLHRRMFSTQRWWESQANIESIRDYAIQQGLLIRASDDPKDGRAVNIAVTLFPSKFPQELFELAYSIAPDINDMIDAVSRDHQFLESVLKRYRVIYKYIH